MTMKRNILILCGVYCLSVCAAVTFSWLDTGVVFVFLALVSVIYFFCFRGRRIFALLLILCAAFGFTHTAYRNNAANFMPAEFEALTVYVQGIVQETKRGDKYCYYVILPQKISIDTVRGIPIHAYPKAKLAVTVYEKDGMQQPYTYGDRLALRGTFMLPDTPDNEGAFDFGMWNKTDGIYGAIITDETCVQYVDRVKSNPIERAAYKVRSCITECIETYIGADAGGLLAGILISDRSGISEELSDAITKSGLSHMCVASGMHVAVLSGILFWLFSRLRLKRVIYYPLSGLVLGFFALVVGGGASIMRAVLMFHFCAVAFLTRGDEDRLYTTLCCAFLMLLYNPLYLFSAGFVLSFACVFGILLFSRRVETLIYRIIKWHPLSGALAVSLCAQIFTLPIIVRYFHGVPVFSLVYNVLLTWLVSPLMILGMLLVLVSGFWSFGAQAIGFVLKLMLVLMRITISTVKYIPFAYVAVEAPSIVACVLYYALVLGIYAVMVKKINWAHICKGIACICILLMTLSTFVDSFYVKLHFINVGEGDSALFRMPGGTTVLLDGGGSAMSEKQNVGKNTVLPYLQYRGVNEIDYAIVSHYDADHAQGVLYICENMCVKNLVLPYRHPLCREKYKALLEQCAENRGIRVHYMQAGDSMRLPGGLKIEALSPDAQILQYKYSENELSLVLRICYGETKMLFTGDAERIAEQRLCASGEDLQAELLKVAHHGALGSSSDAFIERVSPRYALISAGKYSVSQHPAPRTQIVLKRVGAEIYNTATAGDVTFYMRKNGIQWVK